jgi:hypothetical protein
MEVMPRSATKANKHALSNIDPSVGSIEERMFLMDMFITPADGNG